jgi:arylsulfatase A-like enzyme
VRGDANVIIIFAESFSARRIGAYGSTAPDITPNIDRFARDNMKVVNYYNHTAATYRGIRGQLCSMYPTFCGVGGWDDASDKIPNMKVNGLPQIFNQLGYRTAFIGSTPANQAKMEFQVKSIGFDDVLFKEAILEKYLVGESPLSQNRHLSDHQLFRALRLFLDGKARSNERLFVCVWNIETHPNFEVASDGRRYAGGANPVLDTAFNFDHAFGEFLEYFRGSRFNKDTLLILTADHAHMPSKEFVEAAGAGYTAFFIDTIPLLVHDPFDELPGVFDAKQATSLDLAPSLLQMMRIPNQKNHFMGRSIFERQRETSVAYYGAFFYSIDKDGVHDYLGGVMDASIQTSLRRFIRYTQQLEVRDNLWDSR